MKVFERLFGLGFTKSGSGSGTSGRGMAFCPR